MQIKNTFLLSNDLTNILGWSRALKINLCAIRAVQISQKQPKNEISLLRYYDVIIVKNRCKPTELSQITLIDCLLVYLTRLSCRKPYVEKRDFDKLFLHPAIMTSSWRHKYKILQIISQNRYKSNKTGPK